MTLFASYIKERLNKDIIEDHRGFATYFFLQDGVYIEDLYVEPYHRHANVASEYADQIAVIAKAKGFNKMYGSIVPSALNSTDGVKVLLAYGFRLSGADKNAVFFEKEI